MSSQRAETTGTFGELLISLYSVWLLAVNNCFILRERNTFWDLQRLITTVFTGNHSELWELPYTALHFLK